MKHFAFRLSFIAISLACSSAVTAQQLYRIVGPDGSVTFTDQPPPPSVKAQVTTARTGGPADANAALPLELRSVVQRFPVTIYTGKDCRACDSARQLLVGRGVPFTERTIGSQEDAESLRRISGEATLPFATIGGQQLKGFSDVEWSQFLDAAGYPKKSALPANFRNPAPAPLVARAAPAAAPAPAASAAPAPAPAAAPAAGPDNPTGIRF